MTKGYGANAIAFCHFIPFYSTSIGSFAVGKPSADTLSMAVPRFNPSTTTTNSPLKSGISVELKATSEVASPLQAARYLPAPDTSNFILLVAVGHGVPFLSTTDTVTNERSSPFDDILLRSAFSTMRAGAPAVRTIFSPRGVPS